MVDELEGMFDGEVVVLTSTIDVSAVASLGAREAALVARAVDKRKNEFATARVLARKALARFGVTEFEILHDEKRAPVWPQGIAGSLSHCRTRAFAAIGRRDEIGTLGIDVEDRATLSEDLWSHILLTEERVFLQTVPEAIRGRLALVIFSAKESLYKAQYPRSRTFMDFADLRVSFVQSDGAVSGTLACEFQCTVGPFPAGTVVTGRFREVGAESSLVTTVQIRDASE